MASKLQCDETQWPLVVLQAPVQWGVDSVVRYTELTSALLHDGRAIALVFDLRGSMVAPPHLRGRLAAHRRWLFQHAGERLVSECVVVGSRLQRESATVPSESTSQHPAQHFFSDLDPALAFARARLAQATRDSAAAPPRPSGVVWKPLHKARDVDAEHFTLARKRSS